MAVPMAAAAVLVAGAQGIARAVVQAVARAVAQAVAAAPAREAATVAEGVVPEAVRAFALRRTSIRAHRPRLGDWECA